MPAILLLQFETQYLTYENASEIKQVYIIWA